MSLSRVFAWLPVRQRALGLLVVVVAAAHLVLLDPWLRPAPARAAAPATAVAVQTRSIVSVPPPVTALSSARQPPPAMPAPAAVPASPRPTVRPLAAPAVEPEPTVVEAPAPPPALPAPPVPVYATAPPPSIRLHFAVERGAQQGEATLDWAVEDGGRYTLRLHALLDGRQLLGSVSRGAFDAAGLAPERFVETRRQRELRAANFEREAGAITFSGPGHRAELAPGAQDRLSWWLQLAAVLQADPALQAVTLSVTGARGDSRVWTFTAVPPAADETPALRHFHRAAEHPYDTEVDVWLDPALHHLPARMRLLFRAGGEATTFARTSAR